jgi:hypothetical protein
MNWMIGWATGTALAVGATCAMADDPLVVVELYTSQGCSSCPPADALLGEIVGRSDVLPLALHVDYWDYIGWKDEFASPAFTARQKAYARAANARTIYTPQMIVSGQDHLIGTHSAELMHLIAAHGAEPPRVDLSLSQSNGRILVAAVTSVRPAAPLIVQLVRYTPEQTVEIRSGENADQTITYHNIVTEWREIGRWSGEAPLSLEVDLPGNMPAAVILQEEGPGAIWAAAALR